MSDSVSFLIRYITYINNESSKPTTQQYKSLLCNSPVNIPVPSRGW